MESRTEYFTQLNGLRGLAAMMVLVGHTSYGVGVYMAHHPGTQPFWTALNTLGTYGVEVFFLISGFVIAMSISRYDAGTFYKLRFARIYPLYLIATLGFFAANQVLRIEAGRITDLQGLLANVFGLSLILDKPTIALNGWTLVHEMWFYILGYPLLKNLVTRDERIPVVWTAIGIACMALYLFWFPITIYFLTGNLMYVLYRRGVPGVAWPVALLAGLTMIIVGALYEGGEGFGEVMSPWALVLFAATVVAFWGVVHEVRVYAWLSTPFAQFLALISYSLYLLHPYPYFVLKIAIFNRIQGILPDVVFVVLFYAATISLSIGVAWISWFPIEHTIYDGLKKRLGIRKRRGTDVAMPQNVAR